MAFEPGKLGAGAVLYAGFVLLPTIDLLLLNQGWTSPFLQRLFVGLLGVFAGHLMWEGLRGPPGAPASREGYPGLNPVPLLAGLLVLYLAWQSNLPHYLAGTLTDRVFVAKQAGVMRLGRVWPRILTTALSMIGVALTRRGFRVPESPVERKARRRARKEHRRSRPGDEEDVQAEWM